MTERASDTTASAPYRLALAVDSHTRLISVRTIPGKPLRERVDTTVSVSEVPRG